MRKKLNVILLFLFLTNCGSSKFNVSHGVDLEPLPKEIRDKLIILELEKVKVLYFQKNMMEDIQKVDLKNDLPLLNLR